MLIKNRTTPILAALIAALLVMPLALAGAADGPRATASANGKLVKQLKGLKARVAALEGRGSAPTGPAGGSLAGTYPNPTIADGTIALADMSPSTHLLCPGNRVWLQGACMDTATRPQQNYADARNDCAIVGGRLATVAELELFKRSGGTVGTAEYTINLSTASAAFTYDNSTTIAVESNLATAHQFRCVLRPTG